MQLFAFEQSPTYPPAEGGVREIVEDEDGLKHAPEFTHRTVKVVPRPTGQQAFEGDGGRRVARRKGGEKLAHAVPVGSDPVEMNRPLFLADKGGEGAIRPLGINAVNPLVMEPSDARTKPLPKHGEGRKVQFNVAMGIGIVFLWVEIGLVIE